MKESPPVVMAPSGITAGWWRKVTTEATFLTTGGDFLPLSHHGLGLFSPYRWGASLPVGTFAYPERRAADGPCAWGLLRLRRTEITWFDERSPVKSFS